MAVGALGCTVFQHTEARAPQLIHCSTLVAVVVLQLWRPQPYIRRDILSLPRGTFCSGLEV